MVCPSKEHTYLTQSVCLIPWPFYGIVMPWLACFFPVLAPAKRALFIPHTLAKWNWQNPQPAKRSTLEEGPFRPRLGAIKNVEPLAEKEWTWTWVHGGSELTQMHKMHINLNAHSQVKIWNPTPECPNQIYPPLEVFHGLFTSFSRPFHEFFTAFSHFWVLRCFCIFSWQFPQKQWRHDFQTAKKNHIKQISDRHA